MGGPVRKKKGGKLDDGLAARCIGPARSHWSGEGKPKGKGVAGSLSDTPGSIERKKGGGK